MNTPLQRCFQVCLAVAGLTLVPNALLAKTRNDQPAYINAAVADASRPPEDKTRDAERKPVETLAFAGIRPGQQIVELFPGRGYYTRLLSKVVGEQGKVFATSPTPKPDAPAGAPDPGAAMRALAAEPGYGNVVASTLKDRLVSVDAPVDVVWTSLNYHDIHNAPNVDMLAFNKSVYAALKPGGVYIIIDHAATGGSGARDTNTLHRIDVGTVKMEVVSAGFKLAGESPLLRRSSDDHTLKVFDPAIRGKTDQFLLKFVRPN